MLLNRKHQLRENAIIVDMIGYMYKDALHKVKFVITVRKKVGHFEQVCHSSKQKASKSISTVIISAIQKLAGLSESDRCELPKLDILE